MLVLLVEDDEDYAEIIAQTVRRDGHDVVIAPSTSSAQRFASQREPGMAILDVVLPDGTGMDVCRDCGRAGRASPCSSSRLWTVARMLWRVSNPAATTT